MHVFRTKNYEIIDEKKISKDLKEKCRHAYKVNKDFFGKDCELYFAITISHTEKDFKRLAGKFYSPWVKAVATKEKGIIMRSPSLFNRTYKKFGGTPKFTMVLAHEINHAYAYTYNLYKGPYWLTEGLAMYVAGQVPGKTFKKKTKYTKKKVRNLMFYRLIFRKLTDDMYAVHYGAVDFLVRNYGEEKLRRLIKSFSKNNKKRDFEKNFMRMFGLSYNKFLRVFTEEFWKSKRY